MLWLSRYHQHQLRLRPRLRRHGYTHRQLSRQLGSSTPVRLSSPQRQNGSLTTQAANVGPVHLNDAMVLQWSPSTAQANITLFCDDFPFSSQDQPLGASALSEPFLYKFNKPVSVQNPTDPISCYMSFLSSSQIDNTVVWQFNNSASDEPKTWRADAASSSVVTKVTSLRSSSTGTTSVSAHQTSKSSSPPTTSSTAGGDRGSLSTGATAGIAVCVVVAVLAICAALFFFRRSRRNKRHPNNQSHGGAQQQYHNQEPQQPMSEAPSDGVFRHEAPNNYTPNELATHSPNQLSALQTPVELPSR